MQDGYEMGGGLQEKKYIERQARFFWGGESQHSIFINTTSLRRLLLKCQDNFIYPTPSSRSTFSSFFCGENESTDSQKNGI